MPRLSERMYWRSTPREPLQNRGGYLEAERIRAGASVAEQEEYEELMNHIHHMRVKLRGTAHGVSRPPVSLSDHVDDPHVLKAYKAIEIWKLKKAAQRKRAFHQAAEAQWQSGNPHLLVGRHKYTRSGTLIIE